MGHGLWQGIDVARLAKTKATRLDGSVREIDKRKPAFGHARDYSAGGEISRVVVRGVGAPPERLAPKILESCRCQLSVAHGVLDILMPEIGLQRSGVMAVVSELEATGMSQHVRMRHACGFKLANDGHDTR